MIEREHHKAPIWPVTPAVRYLEGRKTPVVLPYIYADAQPDAEAPDNSPTVAEAVRLCEKAVAEAWRACKEAGETGIRLDQSMKLTWQACLPPLDCIHSIRIYVALISWAQVQFSLPARDVKTYAYLAQVAMQAQNQRGADAK